MIGKTLRVRSPAGGPMFAEKEYIPAEGKMMEITPQLKTLYDAGMIAIDEEEGQSVQSGEARIEAAGLVEAVTAAIQASVETKIEAVASVEAQADIGDQFEAMSDDELRGHVKEKTGFMYKKKSRSELLSLARKHG